MKAAFADRMDNDQAFAAAEEARSSRRGRIMGKLFGAKDRERDRENKKAAQETAFAASVDAFLNLSSDSPSPAPTSPSPQPSLPKLAKLDTSIARYPAALNQQGQQGRSINFGQLEARSPKRSARPGKQGLVVRFADSPPEVIGEGGDESEMPVAEIAKRRPPKKSPAPPSVSDNRGLLPVPGKPPVLPDGGGAVKPDISVQPKPLVRAVGSISSLGDKPVTETRSERTTIPRELEHLRAEADTTPRLKVPGPRFLGVSDAGDANRKSYIELQQAEMRQAEGRAFAKAVRTVSAASQHAWEEKNPSLAQDTPESPVTPIAADLRDLAINYSPVTTPTEPSGTFSPLSQALAKDGEISIRPPKTRKQSVQSPPALGITPRSLSVRITDGQAAKDALDLFIARTKHLFELFRLHAESRKAFSSLTATQCVRGALWWFVKGRMGLEAAIRDVKPTMSPTTQKLGDTDRQQAYANLAKAYWLCEVVAPGITKPEAQESQVLEVAQTLMLALAKLSVSMKRNGLLPPEEAFLPQTIDKSIWLEYPALSQDMIALLTGNWGSALTAMQTPMSYLELLDAFPLGDTPETFSYGRVMADVYLMEQGRENQRLHLPCMLSMVRPTKQSGLVFVLASQDGNIQLPIQEIKNAGGPVWEDVRWRNDTCTLDVRLPRGFMLMVQLAQSDYRGIWNMYEFVGKLRATLQPRKDEQLIFRNTLPSFQYLDADPQSRLFPKEAVSQCEMALFESIYKENGPAGPRSWHTGFRIAVVTGSRNKAASGVQHTFPPPAPIQFGFFRGEGDAPAFSVKIDNGRQKGRMVMVFCDASERFRFHSLLTGTALDHGEKIMADVPIKNFSIAQSLREPIGMAPFSRMPWTAARVVNDEYGPDGEEPPTVLADRLRIVLEYQHGTMTDRVNVAPGELKIRLEVSNAKIIRILRQPQQDTTLSVSEAHIPKELPRNMADSLQLIKMNQTIRTVEFNNLRDLHKFELALTGFEVIFDALAVTFAISRRRMVVPIHKKWEAGYTRIQIVKQEDKQLQLLAFFEGFQHGHSMNFVLKGTDVYESFHRGSKSGLKFVDAKFPLPRLPEDKDGDYDDMAFACLDLPEIPGEHDDITLMFEKEEDRDRLCQCLPAPVKQSRMSSRLK